MGRVLIVHSCPVMCAGLRSALQQAQGIQVAAETSDAEAALRLIQETRPDVVLIAGSLPGAGDGAAVAEQAMTVGRGARIVALCALDDHELLYRFFQAGVAGCISERATLKAIVRAVEAVACGERFWTPDQIARLQSWWASVGSKLKTLTQREGETLALMAEGLTDRQIAQCLWVSENTVHTHVRRVLAKLESSTRQEAVLFALRNVSRGGLRTW